MMTSIVDGMIVLAVAVLLFFALKSIRKNGTCTSDCSSCHGVCHARKGKTPDFVKAYRKDHPKNIPVL